jgi:DNA replication and repair protein RecF
MLRDLRLRDFRCFDQLVFEPSPGLNLIVGANAQGKTSLLEAACVLLRLQSPRSSSLADAVRFGRPGFGLDGHWNNHHLQIKYADSLKAFALDSKPQSRSAEYLAVARVSWISNEDIQLVRGSGTQRRRYLDFLGAQVVPNYLPTLRAYERTLRSRNALLKENRPRREIEAFDSLLIETGEALISMRKELCSQLQPMVTEGLRSISGGSEELAISYQPGSPPNLCAGLRTSQEEEMRLQTTVIGPHRDDIAILLEGRDAASFASEGQQRSTALALKLGQARRLEASAGGPPLYLIDDIFGELDPNRRNNLLVALPAAAQKLVTATSLNWMETKEHAAFYFLSDGRIAMKS